MTAQPSRAMSVGRSVVRRRLTVMLTMTTDDDSATHSPTSAAASRSRPASIRTAAARPVEITTWSGAAQSSGPWSRRSLPRSTSMPTSKSSSTTPTSARSSSWSWSATYPGVNGENPSPTARYPTMAGSPSRRATQPAATAASRMSPISRMGAEVASIVGW